MSKIREEYHDKCLHWSDENWDLWQTAWRARGKADVEVCEERAKKNYTTIERSIADAIKELDE